jgi:pimeloyl-ACP methyl ester carboxylesterase
MITIKSVAGADIETISFPPATDMTRADVTVVATVSQPKAAVVICPGFNSTGEEFSSDPAWVAFAKEQRLGLLVLSFATDPKIVPNRGYFFPASGSGNIVLEAVRKVYGRDLPLLLYGFSSGARFTHQFAEWQPGRVRGWVAVACSTWSQTRHVFDPPGLIACGALDDTKYQSSLKHFRAGRSLGKRWLWVKIPETVHERSPSFEEFAREYLASVMSGANGCWVNIDRKVQISEDEAEKNLPATGWLPNEKLFERWKEIHE